MAAAPAQQLQLPPANQQQQQQDPNTLRSYFRCMIAAQACGLDRLYGTMTRLFAQESAPAAGVVVPAADIAQQPPGDGSAAKQSRRLPFGGFGKGRGSASVSGGAGGPAVSRSQQKRGGQRQAAKLPAAVGAASALGAGDLMAQEKPDAATPESAASSAPPWAPILPGLEEARFLRAHAVSGGCSRRCQARGCSAQEPSLPACPCTTCS